jgi:ribonucleoside-diphosphate reductase beta chain
MSVLKKPSLFNPKGSDAPGNVSIFEANTTGLVHLTNLRYPSAFRLYQKMCEAIWFPERTSLAQDVIDLASLSSDEKRAFKGILSFLIYLDSLQVGALSSIQDAISAKEVQICIAAQTFFETIHSWSYQHMLSSLFTEEEQEEVYYFWRTDEQLRKRCEFIVERYETYRRNPTKENLWKALVTDLALEGIYFYQGFIFFFQLAFNKRSNNRGRMVGTASIIQMIRHDESMHVAIYYMILREVIQNYNVDTKEIRDFFREVVEHEIDWSNYIINGIEGINRSTIDQYVKYLTNIHLRAIGLGELYTDKKYKVNPYDYLEDTMKKEGDMKANFFESIPTSYGFGLGGWDQW